MSITAAMDKDLREKTAAGMMDSKKALTECAGDMEKAVDWLRQKGLSKAAKKAGRATSEGLVGFELAADGKSGVAVEVKCETDFVARGDKFQGFVKDMVAQVAKGEYADSEALLSAPFVADASVTVKEALDGVIATTGENMGLGKFAKMELAAGKSGLIDENGEVIHMQEALMADAISTAAGALVGTSTVTTVVESSAGIAAGGRTGMTSLVTAALFLGAIIFAPVVSIVPAAATAPALIFVGVLMLSNIKDVDFSDMTNGLPAFCTVVFMPFTYSIANGIAMGLITYCLLKILARRPKEVEVLTGLIAVVFVFRYAFMTLG